MGSSTDMAEKAILGILMQDNQQWLEVVGRISKNDFICDEHRLIFKAIGQLAERDDPFDAITVSEWLEHHRLLDEIGGLATLGLLVQQIPEDVSLRECVNHVRVSARRRRMNGGVIDGFKSDDNSEEPIE